MKFTAEYAEYAEPLGAYCFYLRDRHPLTDQHRFRFARPSILIFYVNRVKLGYIPMGGVMQKPAKVYILVSALLISLFLIGATGFFRLMPAFENSDELGHVGYVIALARDGRLPRVQTPPAEDVFDQEGFQTPIYYVSAALFLGDVPEPVRPPVNPAFHHAPAHPGSGPHRLYLPIEPGSSSALRAMEAACKRVRFVSIGWGGFAAIAAAALMWQLSKGNIAHALLALGIFLFNPRWMETTASAGNDAAATAAATATLLLLVHLLQKKEITLLQSFLLGICCGGAALTKLNNIGLIVLAIPVVIVKSPIRRYAITIVLLSWALPLLPWMIRNQLMYGHFLAADPDLYRYYVSIREEPLGLIRFLTDEFQGFRWSYFAVFGQFGVLADGFVYPLLDVFLLAFGIAAIAALVIDFRSVSGRVEKWIVLLPVLWLAVIFTEFAFHNRTFMASQGRLIFPASACIAHLLARGCLWLAPGRTKLPIAIFICTLMIAFAFYVILSVLPRAYA